MNTSTSTSYVPLPEEELHYATPDGSKQSPSQNNKKGKKLIYVVAIGITLVLIALITCLSLYLTNDNSNSNNNDPISNYVLPNASLTVINNNAEEIGGNFTIYDYVNSSDTSYLNYTYLWKSILNETYEAIIFIQQNYNNNDDKNKYSGFILNHTNDDNLVYTIYVNNELYDELVINANITLNANETKLMEEWLSSKLSEHFIQLSVKLASIGYTGNDSVHLLSHIHNLAQWIYTAASTYGNINTTDWTELDDEFTKTNEVVDSAAILGYWPSTISEMKSVSTSNSNGRSLLGGNCNIVNQCSNSCFGMCGSGCTCWSWVCGDCSCYKGCYSHDTYCSCVSSWAFCCLNVFWVRCDGSGSC